MSDHPETMERDLKAYEAKQPVRSSTVCGAAVLWTVMTLTGGSACASALCIASLGSPNNPHQATLNADGSWTINDWTVIEKLSTSEVTMTACVASSLIKHRNSLTLTSKVNDECPANWQRVLDQDPVLRDCKGAGRSPTS